MRKKVLLVCSMIGVLVLAGCGAKEQDKIDKKNDDKTTEVSTEVDTEDVDDYGYNLDKVVYPYVVENDRYKVTVVEDTYVDVEDYDPSKDSYYVDYETIMIESTSLEGDNYNSILSMTSRDDIEDLGMTVDNVATAFEDLDDFTNVEVSTVVPGEAIPGISEDIANNEAKCLKYDTAYGTTQESYYIQNGDICYILTFQYTTGSDSSRDLTYSYASMIEFK